MLSIKPLIPFKKLKSFKKKSYELKQKPLLKNQDFINQLQMKQQPIYFLINKIIKKYRIKPDYYRKFLHLDLLNLELELPFYLILKQKNITTINELICLSLNDLLIFSTQLEQFLINLESAFINYFNQAGFKN